MTNYLTEPREASEARLAVYRVSAQGAADNTGAKLDPSRPFMRALGVGVAPGEPHLAEHEPVFLLHPTDTTFIGEEELVEEHAYSTHLVVARQRDEIEALTRERDQLAHELDGVAAERDRLAGELNAVAIERDQYRDDRQRLEMENRDLARDLDDALDIDQAHALDPDHERLAVVPSCSPWQRTAPNWLAQANPKAPSRGWSR